MTCQSCKYVEETNEYGPWYCRRYAPLAVKQNVTPNADWPSVQPNDWCGEYCPKPAITPRVYAYINAPEGA